MRGRSDVEPLARHPSVTRREHHVVYDFVTDSLRCYGCGRVLMTAEFLWQKQGVSL